MGPALMFFLPPFRCQVPGQLEYIRCHASWLSTENASKPASVARTSSASREVYLYSQAVKETAVMTSLVRHPSQLMANPPVPFEAPLGKRTSSVPVTGAIPRRDPAVSCPLSFAQQRLWFLNQVEPNNSAYNFSRAFLLTGPLDAAVLERCLVELVLRHEVLRTTFHSVAGEPSQRVSSAVSMTLPLRDLGLLPERERPAEAPSASRRGREAAVRFIPGPDAAPPFWCAWVRTSTCSS